MRFFKGNGSLRNMTLPATAVVAAVGVSAVIFVIFSLHTPYSVYTRALKKLNNAEQVQLSSVVTLGIALEEHEIPMTTTLNMKKVMANKSDLKFEMDMSMKVLDDEKSIKAYYNNGIYYREYLGEETRREMTQDEALSQMYVTTFDITKDSIKKSSKTKTDNGTELKFLISGDISNEAMDRQYQSLIDNYGVSMEDISISDINITAVVDGNNIIRESSIAFAAAIAIEETPIPINYNITTSVIKLDNVSINFPEA